MTIHTAPHMAWEAAGRPTREDTKDTPGSCLVCATSTDISVPAKKALGANFDYLTGRAQGSTIVCVPCTWALAGKPPATFRMWSIAVTASTTIPPSQDGAPYPSDGRLHLCNRKDMTAIRQIMTRPPNDHWAVCIAVSGQKHLLPYAPVNTPGSPQWIVRFEAMDLSWTPGGFSACLAAVAELRVHGHHPDAIAAGQPSIPALKGDGLTAWRKHEPLIRSYSGSPHIDLALLFTTKENIHAIAGITREN